MGTFKNRDWTFPARCKHCGKRPSWKGMRFGVEKHRIEVNGVPYQDRYMLCLGILEIRLHKFWRGDDDRAPHDHPWWFITFPFKSYLELVPKAGSTGYFENDRDWWAYDTNNVKGWRFHFRPANYKHIVMNPTAATLIAGEFVAAPFWTFVITGRKTQEWGFWRTPTEFTHHRDWCDRVVTR